MVIRSGITNMLSKQRILIIEDDDDINNLLREIVERAGCFVQTAFSGTEGLLYIEQETWDLILLDLMLPGKSGETLLQLTRTMSDVPVIVISAKEESDTKVQLLHAGADDYITKPFNNEEVMARITVQLRRYERFDDGKKRTYKDIVLDEDTKRVTVSGQEIILTAREYAILQLFMTNPNKMFTKENIYESVWESGFLGDENTVHVHLSHLRAKLQEANPQETYIETIWGLGYRLKKQT